MEIRFFKGFSHSSILRGIAPKDLPVVANYPERAVTIWITALFD